MDITWRYCFLISLSILVIIIFAWIQIVQHLHCIPRSSSRAHSEIQPKHVKKFSTVSVNFAAFSAILNFLSYPVWSTWKCGDTALGYLYSAIWWNSCYVAKISLYLTFIGRLFNPHYQRIYQYSQYIQYFLWMLLIVLTICIIEYNIITGLLITDHDPYLVDGFGNAVYAVTDIVISTATMLLFFRPLCRRSMLDFNLVNTSVLQKYCILSVLQWFAAILFQLSWIGKTIMYSYLRADISLNVRKEYNDIMRTIQMLDSLLLIICIYFGFSRKQTVCVFLIDLIGII